MTENGINQCFNPNWLLYLGFFAFFSLLLSGACSNRNDGDLSAKPGESKSRLKFLSLLGYHLISFLWQEHVHLVHRHYQLIHEYLSQHYALCRLGLYEFLRVHHKHHHVNDAGTADDGLHERSMPRAVHKCELNELYHLRHTVLISEPRRYANDKR